MNRRDFLKFSAYMAVAFKLGGPLSSQALANGTLPQQQGLKGAIVAAAYNPLKEGKYSRHTHETVLASLDLDTGKSNIIPLDIKYAHDTVKVKENYLVLPNSARSNYMTVSNFDGNQQKIPLPKNLTANDHAFFDEDRNVLIVPASHNEEGQQGYFIVLDPDNYKVIDTVRMGNFSPHDIQLLDKNTFSVCHYNRKAAKNKKGYKYDLRNNESFLALYDRNSLKRKKTIPAYKNALITHATVTKEGDLFAIGSRDYYDEGVSSWENDFIIDKFEPFFKENHPELLSQWPDIVRNTKVHRVEKSTKSYGLSILPLKLSEGGGALETMAFEHFHHRRAQSICYVQQTNTVCMAFPHSDSILIYNASTGASQSFNGRELNLAEMRGITEIENTPYLAVAGIRRGFTIIDTSTHKSVKHFDVGIGRIIHMHHIL